MLARRIENAAVDAAANAAGVEAGIGLAGGSGRGCLDNAARYVCGRRDDVRFDASVGAGAATGEIGDIVGIVRLGVRNAAPVHGSESAYILTAANAYDVLARSRGSNRLVVGTGISRRKHNNHLLVAAHRNGRARRLGIAHQSVVGL